jgi:hypothetical protein
MLDVPERRLSISDVVKGVHLQWFAEDIVNQSQPEVEPPDVRQVSRSIRTFATPTLLLLTHFSFCVSVES